MMRLSVLSVLSILFLQSVLANEPHRSAVLKSVEHQRVITGNFSVDFFGKNELALAQMLQDEAILPVESQRKSPWLAAGLSLVLPGAGEVYAENYWKAAVFLVVDIAAWGLAYHFDKKGDKQTELFQNYANQHWNVVSYARYSLDHYLTDQQRLLYEPRLFKQGGTPWEQVNWNVLNEMERVISSTAEGKFYSHTLPAYGDQQYFELIGKYQQFYQGWNDADPNLRTYDQIAQKLLSDKTNFIYYAGERGKANDFYTTATTYVTVAIVNHVLSAVDAAWTASTYNRNLHASVRIQSIPTGLGYARVPVARMEYSF